MQGFTLIELSIVLVVIGLIVGGILVGQDLIRAAEVRAQITQIEKYNSAVNTFRSKFGYLPGDMRPEVAQQFGFYVGTGCAGTTNFNRNGDGLIDGWYPGVGSQIVQGGQETALFWVDLSSQSAGNLIDNQFPNSGGAFPVCGANIALSVTPGTAYIGDNYPVSKLGKGNFLYVYDNSGSNWYGLSAVTNILGDGELHSNAIIPVIEAYNIDKKIDDGVPMTGDVQAVYINGNIQLYNAPNTTTSGGNSTSCYDTTTSTYSITYNNGSGANCALSFKFN